MNFADINPFIRYTQQRHLSENYPRDVIAYDFRMFYGIVGNITVIADSKRFEVTPNTFVLIPPQTPYRLCVEKSEPAPHSFGVLNFDMTRESAHRKKSLPPQYPEVFDPSLVFSVATPPETEKAALFEGDYRTGELFGEIVDLFLRRPALYREEAGARLKLLLILARRNTAEKDSETPPLVEKVLEYVRAHYNQNITNATLSREFLYHPNYINRVFKNAMGESLHQYVIHYRLRIAKAMLTTTTGSIDEVAHAVGFESPSYFSKYFKQVFGESPLAFRKNYLKQLL